MQQPQPEPWPWAEHRPSYKFPDSISVISVIGLAVPWLNPAAGGPSAVVQPWLVAAAVAVLAWHFVAPGVARWQLGFATLVVALLTGVGQAAPPAATGSGENCCKPKSAMFRRLNCEPSW